MTLVKIVATVLTSTGTPNAIKSVVIAISGIPISKGTPAGIDFTAAIIDAVIIIVLNGTG